MWFCVGQEDGMQNLQTGLSAQHVLRVGAMHSMSKSRMYMACSGAFAMLLVLWLHNVKDSVKGSSAITALKEHLLARKTIFH